MKTAHDIINESGYPLQLFVAEEVNSLQHKHGWKVLVQEHRWSNSATQDEGFIDIVLEHGMYVVRLVVECKRVSGNWTFLLPNINPNFVRRIKSLKAEYPSPIAFTWEDKYILPESYEASFCVMDVEGKKDNRTLEKLSGELLTSLENLAVEETQLLSKVAQSQHHKLYIPMIVTTANTQVCLCDPKDISAEDGSIKAGSEIKQIDFIRFRKNLAGSPEYRKQDLDNLPSANLENERTIVVVQAKSISTFLQNFGIL